MPSELVEEQIFANIATTLTAIRAGSTYHYTPEVTRADQYAVAGSVVLSQHRPIAIVIRDSSESVPGFGNRVFGKDSRVLPVFILLAHYDDSSDMDPWTRDQSRALIRHRRIRDAVIALNADRTRGGLAHNQEIVDINKDYEEGAGKWILAEIAIEVEFDFDYDAP